MIRFPITDLLGQQECDDYLLNTLHPNGFRCPEWHRRPDIQQPALEHKPTAPLTDPITEADEMFQNAGEKGEKHDDPDDPPRCRAHDRPGQGTMDNDRPPILGVVGRTTGHIHLTVSDNTQQATIQPQVEQDTLPTTLLNTDESHAYNHIPDTGRGPCDRLSLPA